ncbi:MAG: hypothetical protein H8E44_06810 [Planctomycetes bacterium]|nr:hypothetical protein [Planctomycetota bacterium]MBL7043011.1 hypothetical protein [Pirellulaceae bacterium]
MTRSIATLTVVLLIGLAAAYAQRPPEPKKAEIEPLKGPVVTPIPVKPTDPWSPDKPGPTWRPLKLAPNAPKVRRVPNVQIKVVEPVREVITLRNLPAIDVAKTINELLRSERPSRMDEVAIVPEPLGNRLLISASPSMFEEVLELIEKIDVRPKCVVIETLIAEVVREDKADGESPFARFIEADPSPEEVAALIEKLKKSPNVEILAQPMVTTLDNQSAFIQLGRRVPTVKTVATESGQRSKVEYENVGLILGVTPRVSADNLVTMEIDLEKSEVASGGPEAGAATPSIDVTMAQTTVATESGKPLVLGGLKAETSTSAKEVILIVTPRILDGSSK